MGKRLKNYLAYIDGLLARLEADGSGNGSLYSVRDSSEVEQIIREHLIQISFFGHERLIHLIVTCLFAVLTFAVFFIMLFTFNIGLIVLFAALLVLLFPYIRHYYILENGVQKMYVQYDRMREILHRCNTAD